MKARHPLLVASVLGVFLSLTAAAEEGAAPREAMGKSARSPHPSQNESAGGTFARAALAPRSGSTASGSAVFARTRDGIQVTLTASGASPGKHGIHIHEKGDCSAADASSAGDHFNPTGHQHGAVDPDDFHVGDLGNINVGRNGEGVAKVLIPYAKSHSFSQWDEFVGKSVVLHASADDLKSQPAGNSGARIACGVIEKVGGNLAH